MKKSIKVLISIPISTAAMIALTSAGSAFGDRTL
ncbi:hypothetical protein BAAL111456_25260 [Bacillus albus]